MAAYQEVLSDRTAVSSLVALSDPMVRALDGLTGEAVAMRVRGGGGGGMGVGGG